MTNPEIGKDSQMLGLNADEIEAIILLQEAIMRSYSAVPKERILSWKK